MDNPKKINWMQTLGWNSTQLEDLRILGYAYIKQGHYEIARKFFEALVVLDAQNAYHLQTLGAIYLQTGNYLYALSHLERALKLDPDHTETLFNKAKTLYLLGYKEQAEDLTKQLTKNPNKSIADRSQALLLSYS